MADQPGQSVTRWHRLSPTPRNKTIEKGLRAELADPLWLVGRQWQVGELAGEDAGSPIKIECWFEHDPMTRVDLAPGDGDATTARDYDVATDGPLEAIVEREAVLTDSDDPPNRETAVETGRNFLARLDRQGVTIDGRQPRAGDFPDKLLLDAGEGTVDAAGERYLSVTEDRALDGCALYERLTANGNVASAGDWQAVSWGSVDHAYPDSGSPPEGYKRAVTGFVDWYGDLYDEPADGETAWNRDRMEYEFAVATGTGTDETVFTAEEYEGGRLDRDAFTLDPDATLDPSSGTAASQTDKPEATGPGTTLTGPIANETLAEAVSERSEPDLTAMPTQVTFPGMPSGRWWEFEDGGVNLDKMTVGPGEVGKLLLAEFATLYGNDWFSLNIDVPVGSLTRIETLLITDTFGQVDRVDPVTAGGEAATTAAETDQSEEADEGAFGGAVATSGGWNAFMHPDLPNHDEPGLLYPPVLADHHESEPVERVLLARDEMANMAFGIELRTEDAIGDPLKWREFTPATLAVDMVETDGTVAGERVRFTNPGESTIDVGGWVVESDTGASYQFPTDTKVDAGEHLTLYTGPGTDAEPGALFWGRTPQDGPVWDRSAELTVKTGPNGTVVRNPFIGDPANPQLPDYRLVSDVEDYWFPLRMQGVTDGSGLIGDLRFELARLLDADPGMAMPHGDILHPDLRLHDEELTRAGLEVTRTYQFARWIGGTTHLWAGRRAKLGRGEGRSGLRFDYLLDPDPDKVTSKLTEE